MRVVWESLDMTLNQGEKMIQAFEQMRFCALIGLPKGMRITAQVIYVHEVQL